MFTRFVGAHLQGAQYASVLIRLPQHSEEASQTTSGDSDAAAAAAAASSNFITRDWLDLGQIFKKHMTPLIFINFLNF